MKRELIRTADPHRRVKKRIVRYQEIFRKFLENGNYILGDNVKLFENEFSSYNGCSHCIGVASGTDAIAIALQAAGVEPGNEVITVSHTASATIAAIEQIGARPVFADINLASRCIDTDSLEKLISPQTRAIVPVHIYGHPADMAAIMQIAKVHGIKVVEDCAQAHGAKYMGKMVGSIGDVGAFSFYPTKNIAALGDAGAIMTNHDQIADNARLLRQYGWRERFYSEAPGINSRLDELQAALLRIELEYYPNDIMRRQTIAKHYCDALRESPVSAPSEGKDCLHAWHLFVIESEYRDSLSKYLNENDIGTAQHYPYAAHQQPQYARHLQAMHILENTERFYQRHLSIPLYPELTDPEVDRIYQALKAWRP